MPGSAVLVTVPQASIDIVQAELGEQAFGVRFVDTRKVARNPTRMIPLMQRFVDDHPGQHLVVVTEPIWPDRPAAEYSTAMQTEALANVAFVEVAATVACGYDIATLDPATVLDATRTHPVVIGHDGDLWESLHYSDPLALATEFLHPLPEPAGPLLTTMTIDTEHLPTLRDIVTTRSARVGLLRADRLDALGQAVAEAAAETLASTDTPGVLRLWVENDMLICEIRCAGRLLDPLAGRRLPPPGPAQRRGLLLAGDLCSLAQIDAHQPPAHRRRHLTDRHIVRTGIVWV
ncbi:anti-sigma factor RsbA family regulatory protein [Actinopolymorpha singaporensis]